MFRCWTIEEEDRLISLLSNPRFGSLGSGSGPTLTDSAPFSPVEGLKAGGEVGSTSSSALPVEPEVDWHRISAALARDTIHPPSAKECAMHWHYVLKPVLDEPGFTADEEQRILEAYETLGPDWDKIARQMGEDRHPKGLHLWFRRRQRMLSRVQKREEECRQAVQDYLSSLGSTEAAPVTWPQAGSSSPSSSDQSATQSPYTLNFTTPVEQPPMYTLQPAAAPSMSTTFTGALMPTISPHPFDQAVHSFVGSPEALMPTQSYFSADSFLATYSDASNLIQQLSEYSPRQLCLSEASPGGPPRIELNPPPSSSSWASSRQPDDPMATDLSYPLLSNQSLPMRPLARPRLTPSLTDPPRKRSSAACTGDKRASLSPKTLIPSGLASPPSSLGSVKRFPPSVDSKGVGKAGTGKQRQVFGRRSNQSHDAGLTSPPSRRSERGGVGQRHFLQWEDDPRRQ